MTHSLIVKRLSRNLRYKRTYLQVYQAYMEPGSSPRLVELLSSLTEAQQSAIEPLAHYLRDVGGDGPDEKPYDKLLADAARRRDVKSRLRFLHVGLTRSVSWYRMQMVDRHMTADGRLRSLLLDLGEIEAAQLWRTEAAMHLLKIPVHPGQPNVDDTAGVLLESDESWTSRAVEEMGRPEWGGYSKRPPRPSRRRGKS